MAKKPYYITTAIAYTSGKPHIGNTYEIVLADSIARFKRAQGYDVRFQTGTDEHGQKVEIKAAEAGVTPKEYVDGVAGEIKRIWDLMDTSYDRFIRTTDADHEAQVQKIFKKLYDQGDIYKGYYEGKYCTPCESFFTESQLVDGKCPDCGREVIDAKEEAYFFKMSKYADRLIEHINTHPDGNSDPMVEKYWPADLHLIGKDIIRFHTIYWPIMLMALDIPLPKQVFGHPWLLVGEGKMSKSKGNVIYADDLVDYFGVDAVRYFVLHEMPFDNDGSITWELMVERMNSDLANILENLVNRTISMTNKYFGGVVTNPGVNEPVDEELKRVALETPVKAAAKMDKLRVADAITEIFTLFRRCNKYIDETEPWNLAKDEAKKDRLATVLYNLFEGIRIGAVCLEAFLPSTSRKILDQIGTQQRDFLELDTFGRMEEDVKVVEKPEILFARIDMKEFMAKLEADKAAKEAEAAKAAAMEAGIDIEAKPEITYDDFAKLQFQVGEIIACEAVKKSKKLLCSQVKIGSQVRQIVSGIKAHYTPEEMVGKKVMVVTNLKPAKLAGVMSEGMLLCAEDAEGNLSLMVPEKEMPSGAEIC